MKIKKFIDMAKRESDADDKQAEQLDEVQAREVFDDENIVFFNNVDDIETIQKETTGRELRVGRTHWADQSIGDILVSLGKVLEEDIPGIIEHQAKHGMYFGESVVELGLASQDDILQALSVQFGYSYDSSNENSSNDMVMASSPFAGQAEEFRTIRGQLLNSWLGYNQKSLAVVSPGHQEGRSFVAANLALAFSQSGHSTLLIDANLREPRQHEIFQFSRRTGLSMLLAGRVSFEDLSLMPDHICSFQNLSVLGCGAVPPNPSELLSNDRFPMILRELEKYFEVIIVDTPAGYYQADVLSICSTVGSALVVAKSGSSKMEDSKTLVNYLRAADVNMVGSVLNSF